MPNMFSISVPPVYIDSLVSGQLSITLLPFTTGEPFILQSCLRVCYVSTSFYKQFHIHVFFRGYLIVKLDSTIVLPVSTESSIQSSGEPYYLFRCLLISSNPCRQFHILYIPAQPYCLVGFLFLFYQALFAFLHILHDGLAILSDLNNWFCSRHQIDSVTSDWLHIFRCFHNSRIRPRVYNRPTRLQNQPPQL